MPRPRTVADEAILDAALAVILRDGPARLTFASVGEEVGLAPATLVQRFGSKRGLLVAAARRGLEGWTGAFDRTGTRGPLAAIEWALSHGSSGVATREQLAHSVAFLQMDLADPELGALAREGALQVRARLRGLCTDAIAAGELRAGTDPAALALALETTYHGALIGWALSGDGTLQRWVAARVRATLAPWRTA